MRSILKTQRPSLNLALTKSANCAVTNSAIASACNCEGDRKAEAPAQALPLGLLLPSFSDGYSMLAPASQTRIIAQSQSRPLRESFSLGLMVIGMRIVGAGFLYFVTEGLLWLEGCVTYAACLDRRLSC